MNAVRKHRIDIDSYLAESKSVEVDDLPWSEVGQYPIQTDALRALDYIRAVESHTIVFPRTIFSNRAVNDPVIGPFLICWLFEETFHGRALKRFLHAAGYAVKDEANPLSIGDRFEGLATSVASAVWPGFLALHMTWGALHELTTLTSYRRLARLAGHPILSKLLRRIARDEARHFSFYFEQAQERLQDASTARITRSLMNVLWSPVGKGVRPLTEMSAVSAILFAGNEGRAAAERVDATIRALPGFGDAAFFVNWLRHNIPDSVRAWDAAGVDS